MKNIFIIGLDEFNRKELASIREAESCKFHRLLSYDEIVRPKSGKYEFEYSLRKAEQQLSAFSGNIDGIVAFWDFPASALAGVLRNNHGLPGPSNEAIAKCEHKYWSRMEQREVAPDLVPEFCAIDPFANDPLEFVNIGYPFWIKPIKAHSSRLGYRIRDPQELWSHLPEIREKIGFFGEPFGQYLEHVSVPESIQPIDGYWCIGEELISAGLQCTLEGYVYDGEVVVYGVVDSLRSGKHRSCFSRYQYPSTLPKKVQRRMIDATTRVLTRFNYDCGPFNIEYYWDRRNDHIKLLEVNSRISKSHCPLFRMVDGASHQEVMVDLALGAGPRFPRHKGPFRVSAKFMHRVFTDGIVERMPTNKEFAAVKAIYPEIGFRLLAKEGDRLKDSHYYDSYSYELAEIFLGADNQSELLKKFSHVLNMLTFEVSPIYEDAA